MARVSLGTPGGTRKTPNLLIRRSPRPVRRRHPRGTLARRPLSRGRGHQSGRDRGGSSRQSSGGARAGLRRSAAARPSRDADHRAGRYPSVRPVLLVVPGCDVLRAPAQARGRRRQPRCLLQPPPLEVNGSSRRHFGRARGSGTTSPWGTLPSTSRERAAETPRTPTWRPAPTAVQESSDSRRTLGAHDVWASGTTAGRGTPIMIVTVGPIIERTRRAPR